MQRVNQLRDRSPHKEFGIQSSSARQSVACASRSDELSCTHDFGRDSHQDRMYDANIDIGPRRHRQGPPTVARADTTQQGPSTWLACTNGPSQAQQRPHGHIPHAHEECRHNRHEGREVRGLTENDMLAHEALMVHESRHHVERPIQESLPQGGSHSSRRLENVGEHRKVGDLGAALVDRAPHHQIDHQYENRKHATRRLNKELNLDIGPPPAYSSSSSSTSSHKRLPVHRDGIGYRREARREHAAHGRNASTKTKRSLKFRSDEQQRIDRPLRERGHPQRKDSFERHDLPRFREKARADHLSRVQKDYPEKSRSDAQRDARRLPHAHSDHLSHSVQFASQGDSDGGQPPRRCLSKDDFRLGQSSHPRDNQNFEHDSGSDAHLAPNHDRRGVDARRSRAHNLPLVHSDQSSHRHFRRGQPLRSPSNNDDLHVERRLRSQDDRHSSYDSGSSVHSASNREGRQKAPRSSIAHHADQREGQGQLVPHDSGSSARPMLDREQLQMAPSRQLEDQEEQHEECEDNGSSSDSEKGRDKEVVADLRVFSKNHHRDDRNSEEIDSLNKNLCDALVMLILAAVRLEAEQGYSTLKVRCLLCVFEDHGMCSLSKTRRALRDFGFSIDYDRCANKHRNTFNRLSWGKYMEQNRQRESDPEEAFQIEGSTLAEDMAMVTSISRESRDKREQGKSKGNPETTTGDIVHVLKEAVVALARHRAYVGSSVLYLPCFACLFHKAIQNAHIKSLEKYLNDIGFFVRLTPRLCRCGHKVPETVTWFENRRA